MDKNTIIGLLLIVGIIIGFSIINQPTQEEIEAAQRKRDSIILVEKARIQEEARKIAEAENAAPILVESIDNVIVERADSINNIVANSKFGVFANAANKELQYYTLENEQLKITFSNAGARIYSVELKEYRTYDSLPLILFV